MSNGIPLGILAPKPKQPPAPKPAPALTLEQMQDLIKVGAIDVVQQLKDCSIIEAIKFLS